MLQQKHAAGERAGQTSRIKAKGPKDPQQSFAARRIGIAPYGTENARQCRLGNDRVESGIFLSLEDHIPETRRRSRLRQPRSGGAVQRDPFFSTSSRSVVESSGYDP